MKTNRTFTVLRLLVLGVLVAGFNAKPASAQAFQGKFTLPSETRWGQATLPAGDYSFTLDKDYPGSRVTIVRGRQTVAQDSEPRCQLHQVGPFRDRHGKRRSPRGESAPDWGKLSTTQRLTPAIGRPRKNAPRTDHPVAAAGAGR